MIEALGPGPIALDTCVFIYAVEAHPLYWPVLEPLFDAIDQGHLQGVTSQLSLLEVLVVPYREGNVRLAERYQQLLTHSRNFACQPIDLPTLVTAAQLRAATGVRTPDAIQLATAINANATAFLTNDRQLPTPRGLRICQLRDHLPATP